mgnify:CR=1 FL=1
MQNTGSERIGILILIPVLFGLWLVVTSLSEVVPGVGLYDGKRILELYLICLTLSLVLISSAARQKMAVLISAIPGWIRIHFLIFFGLGLSSALLTPNPAYPLLDVTMLYLLMVSSISIACVKQQYKNRFDQIVLVLVAMMGFGVIFQELVGLLVYLSTEQQFNYRESLFHFLHPRLYNQVQTWTIPLLALLPLVFNKYRWIGPLSLILIGAQWYILLSTGARGSTISLVSAMVLVGVILPRSRKLWVKTHISGFVLGAIFYMSAIGFLQAVQPDKTEFVSESIGRPMLHTSGRTDLWKHSIEDAIGNPMFGSGPMRYACDADHYIAGSPHSFPFQVMGEWGIPAFLVLGVLFAWLMYSWFRATKRNEQETIYGQAAISCLSISCFAAAIHVCVSGLLVAPSSQVAGMLVSGWLLGSLFNVSYDSTENRPPQYDAVFLLLLGFVASVSVLIFTSNELENLPFRTSYAQDYGPTTPRFWQDGRFCEYSF